MDKVNLQISRHRLEGIAEEMGEVLQRTAFSANIKERRDFSCAVTDETGDLIAQAAHIPVHLGAIPSTMQAFLETVEVEPERGYLLNDPYRGGTHLPDLSYIVPWEYDGTIRGYVINRAHHTDVGGPTAGSMGVHTHIDQEGFRTGPRPISTDHALDRETIEDLLEISRTPSRRITDLEAQITAARRGVRRLTNWADTVDDPVGETFGALKEYSLRFMEDLLTEVPNGRYRARDVMDDDGTGKANVRIRVEVEVNDRTVEVDYSKSDDQVPGSINCPRAVTKSATYYVLRCLLSEDVPMNQGILDPIEVVTRSGSLLDVKHPGAVAGGNVETSQRIVDCLLSAFSEPLADRVPAASQGTMNNVSFGHPAETAEETYYETLGGGAGAGPHHDGVPCRQVHMTNTQNTPIEEFETHFPVVVTRLKRRLNSGGDGDHEGGDGLIKAWRALEELTVSLLTDRRRYGPYGLRAEDGENGENRLIDETGERSLPGKGSFRLNPGDELVVKTPGGGGWGPPTESG